MTNITEQHNENEWHTLTISLVAVVEVVETLWCFKCPIKCRFAEFLFLIIHGIVATGSKSASALTLPEYKDFVSF
jgi:hypothetical protein